MKLCPYCNKKSYSADGKGQWRCPYCNKDLTNMELQIPDRTGDNVDIKVGYGEDGESD